MMRFNNLFLLFLALGISLSSCVTKKKYTALLTQLETANKDLGDCGTKLNNLMNQLSACEKEKERLKGDINGNQNTLKLKDEQINDLKAQIADLKSQRDKQLTQVGDLTVLSKSANDNIRETLSQLQNKDKYIQLLQLAGTAAAVLWVEPGTHETARDLQTVRDHFREAFDVLAPCTHQGPCGLLAAGMERHWCHHFAPPPPEVFISSDWSRFAVRAGIDLRSVPYSFLCLQRRSAGAAPRSDQGWERLLGRARISKPYARILSCGVCGVFDTEVPKRQLPDWFKTFKNGEEPRRIRWTRDGDRACSAESALSPGLRVNPAD
jgi:hypothetical protein